MRQNRSDKAPLNIAAIYTFGSLPRNVKEVVGDVDLIVIANTTSLHEFTSNLTAFLMEPKDFQAPVRRALLQKYHELSNLAAKARSSEKTWKWPPLSDFIYKEPARSVLVASGVPPEWLNYFTWNEVCNWRRLGMPNGINLSHERLVRRALFGFRRGFQIHYVLDTLQEALGKLATRRPVLAWTPEKADVGKNLAAVAKKAMVADDYENMSEQLVTVKTKNSILETLCRHYLSKIRGPTRSEEETPPQELIETLAHRAGVSNEDMIQFLAHIQHWRLRSAVAKFPSMRIRAPPAMTSHMDVENVRLKLESATKRFSSLVEIHEGLSYLTRSDRLPSDLGAYLLGCVSMKTAPKGVTLSILHQLGVPAPIGKMCRWVSRDAVIEKEDAKGADQSDAGRI